MKLTNRVKKLEQTEGLARPVPLVDQHMRVLDNAALKLTGKTYDEVSHDAVIVNRIHESEDVQFFIRNLSDQDLEALFVAIVPGGAKIIEAAKRKAGLLPALETDAKPELEEDW